MPKLTVDGTEVEFEPGMTVLQACELAGAEVPRFCYHERLSIAGNCRMCLVEMERAPKPVASCAMPAADGMVIRTQSEIAQKARKGVMEFLLINHPLDCPICDQGGECDLQDQAMAFGTDRTRYEENKRAVPNKELGPLVKTIMTRCIHCTRCVRFATEVAGVEELGATGRGEQMEIGTYVEKALSSELSGNMIDLCPVGALTSKPYAFSARPWELRKTESIDVMDAVGTNIRVDARGRQVMRVLPRLNEDVNEEWCSDKTRFACDGLSRQRLDRPYLRGDDGKLAPATWDVALKTAAEKLAGTDPQRIGAIVGDQADAESMTALKLLMQSLGSPNLDCRQDGMAIGGVSDSAAARGDWLFNTTIAGIEDADAILLIGTNPRWEAPVLNARIRKRFLAGPLAVAAIGPTVDLTYPCETIGAGPETLAEVADGTHPFFEVLKAAERPMLILGTGALARPDGAAIHATARKLADATGMIDGDWNGFNVLHRAASRVAGLDLGIVPGKGGKGGKTAAEMAAGGVDVLFLLDADEIDLSGADGVFVICQGHHGDRTAHRADLILPGAAYTEKDGLYVNLEGRPQSARRAVFPPGEAKEDWTILRALSGAIGKPLPFDDIAGLRAKMFEIAPHLAAIDSVAAAEMGPAAAPGPTDGAAFALPMRSFHMSCAISRASETMAACIESASSAAAERTGTDG